MTILYKRSVIILNDKLLNALSYFSVLFFPVITPLIIYFTNEKKAVKAHAKRACISQCIPFVLFIINMLILPTLFFQSTRSIESSLSFNLSAWQYLPLILSFAYSILYFIILLWNVFQGVRALK